MTVDGSRLIKKRVPPHQYQALHTHPDAAFTFVFDGTMRETFADVGAPGFCPRYSVQYKPAKAKHTTATNALGADLLVVNLDTEIAQRLPDRPSITRRTTLTLLGSVLADPDQLDLHAGCIDRVVANWRPETQDATPQWIVDARHMVDGDVADASPSGGDHLRRLARRVGRHPVYLARAFRHYVGSSVGVYLRSLRLDRAVRQLLFSDAPLSEIALDAGYVDQAHFTHALRAAVGVPPAKARAIARKVGVS